MKLWMLKPKSETSIPWRPWHDKVFCHIVRADTEPQARQIAMDNAGDEKSRTPDVWLNPDYSTCEPLSIEGDPGLIVRDFRSG